MASRIYRIVETSDNSTTKKVHLVDAINQKKALEAVAKPRFAIDIPSMQDVIDLTKEGIEVIKT